MAALFHDIYKNCRVFLTGHTGFKGSWMAAWLEVLGARVCGFSKDIPTQPNHFSLCQTAIEDFRGDVNDFAALQQKLSDFEPEIVFHFAAQPLVRVSYENPIETFATNILGTVHLLQACRQTPSVRAVIVITTDKCYENKEWTWGYREIDPLGGHDPYSASKACAEIVTASFRNSFYGNCLIASCRAGNVIGGGDWAKDRLIPDLIRAACEGATTTIRMPHATRPWQHVLEPLRGYLLLGQYLLEGQKDFAQAWNFGPGPEGNLPVGELIRWASQSWDKIQYQIVPQQDRHEATFLMLDCSKARHHLAWSPVWTLEKGVSETIRWYKDYYEQNIIRTQSQIEEYCITIVKDRELFLR